MPPEPRQARAIETRAAILQAGSEEFAERGYAGAKVADIAGRAGLTLGALYFHFRSKADLARAIVLAQPNRVARPEGATGLQRVVSLTTGWARQLQEDVVLLAGARLVMEQDLFVGSQENSHTQWIMIIEEDLGSARKAGDLYDHVDIHALARLIVNACTGAQMQALLETDRRDLPARVAEMWHCLLPAIVPPEVAATVDLGA
ncbi:ScbR family autoregulator-binding transcription factor [Streptomyces alboflavus]|uniref:ScbR family autoregulator-binding transcription factor n=1 Tax=Streptomyces alboflavus TaxID=67267 RepID=UPI00369B1F75